MIVLTIENVKTGKRGLETFTSMDKAEQRLVGVTSAKVQKEKLIAVSYDSNKEKDLCEEHLNLQQDRDGTR